ncbi:MAG: tetratricopeptide repeat protein [Bryobacteraceae bacterium]
MAYGIGVVAVILVAGIAEAQGPQPPGQLQTNEGNEKAFFFSGEVQLDDSSPPPEPVAIYRVCNGQSQFETSTDSKGRFSFEVSDSRNDVTQADASQNSGPPSGLLKPISQGSQNIMPVIAKLRDCEVQAVLAGYRSELVDISVKSRSDTGRLGIITLHPLSRASELTVSATTLAAPANARKAYDKGLDALAKQKLQAAADAFTKAVAAYPKFAIAWYQLGLLREKRNDIAGANDAWKQALASDPKYVRPYESLTMLADHNQDWLSSEAYSRAWIELDPEDFPGAYIYNAVANARLNHTDAAERAAREGLRIDKDHRVPRLNLVLALILMGKSESAEAAKCFRDYLALAPNANDAAAVRQQLSRLDAAAAAQPR